MLELERPGVFVSGILRGRRLGGSFAEDRVFDNQALRWERGPPARAQTRRPSNRACSLPGSRSIVFAALVHGSQGLDSPRSDPLSPRPPLPSTLPAVPNRPRPISDQQHARLRVEVHQSRGPCAGRSQQSKSKARGGKKGPSEASRAPGCRARAQQRQKSPNQGEGIRDSKGDVFEPERGTLLPTAEPLHREPDPPRRILRDPDRSDQRRAKRSNTSPAPMPSNVSASSRPSAAA